MVEPSERFGTEGSSPPAWPEEVPAPTVPVTPLAQPPTFSIVIAAYQAEASIGAALDSALRQTLRPLEIIVCDDGSTDGTAAVLQRFGGRIRTIRQPNAGEGAAKNAVVRQAQGDFVVVLDADDLFHERRLEALARLAMRRPDLDVLTTDATVEADGVPVRRAYHEGWVFPTGDQRAAILQRNFVFGLAAVRRSRWLEAGGFDPSITGATDWDFWLRLILSGSRVGLVAAPLATYRLRSGTLSSDRERLVAARLTVLERAAARSDLSSDERRVVRRAIAAQQREHLFRRAQTALTVGGWTARAAQVQLVIGRGFRARTRAGALLAMAAPSRALRRRQRRLGDTVEIGSGLRVPVNRARQDDAPP